MTVKIVVRAFPSVWAKCSATSHNADRMVVGAAHCATIDQEDDGRPAPLAEFRGRSSIGQLKQVIARAF